jgi:hypothetical protein
MREERSASREATHGMSLQRRSVFQGARMESGGGNGKHGRGALIVLEGLDTSANR